MKKITLSFIALLFALGQFDALAQAPQSFKYQSVARGSNGLPIASANIGLRISVHDGSATGTVVYKETHTAATNAFGVFSISVGGGTIVNGIFSSIDWGSGSKFIEVEADFNGGTSYTSMGASQLLSVPYALYSQNGTPGPKGDKGDKGDAGVAGLKGDKGDSGIAGPQGLPGPIGADGATGAQGLKGDKGDTGDAGPQGIQGLKGDKGDAGDPGVAFDNTQVLTDKTWTSSKINSELGLKVNTSALSTVATSGDYIDLTNKPVTDGSETVVTAGSNVTVTGSGTTTSPYVVNAAGGSGWSLTGNSGTVDGTNFIGTTDDVPLAFKVNNQNAGKIDRALLNTFLGYHSGLSITSGWGNTAIGETSLRNITTGINNTALGQRALMSNSNGSYNTAAGYNSLSMNTSGQYNSAFGINALASNGTGSGNTATGMTSLHGNFIGNSNTANGRQALFSTNADNNTAVGFQAMYSNSRGSNGTAVGYWAMYYTNNTNTPFTNYNVAVGFEALRGSTSAAANTGNYNSALGYQTLWSNTTGNYNTATGWSALYSNTTGNNNTATGFGSLYSNTSGQKNASHGQNALYSNSIGSYNTANGSNALYSNATGNNNTAIGEEALYYNTTGNNNTAIGFSTLIDNSTGSNNTAIGNGANVSTGALTNSTAIGYNAQVTTSNAIQLGDANVTEVRAGTGNTATLVAGGLQITGGSPAAGKVLTSDATGLATWTTPASLPSGTTAGQMLFWNGSAWVTIPAGVNGQNLSFCNGVPTWGGCFQLTVNKTGAGSGTITSNIVGINCPGDCTEYYGGGTVVILTQTPAPGSSFGGWTGGGCSGTGICTITMNSAINVTAPFN